MSYGVFPEDDYINERVINANPGLFRILGGIERGQNMKKIYEVVLVDTEADIIMRTERVIAKSKDEALLRTVLELDEKPKYDKGQVWIGVKELYVIEQD